MSDEFRLNTPGLATPGTASGFHPAIIDDIIPPRYPEGSEVGCEIAIYRPGELAPIKGLERVQIPMAAILCYIVPEEAVNMRPAIEQMKRQLRAAVLADRQRHANMGRRG